MSDNVENLDACKKLRDRFKKESKNNKCFHICYDYLHYDRRYGEWLENIIVTLQGEESE